MIVSGHTAEASTTNGVPLQLLMRELGRPPRQRKPGAFRKTLVLLSPRAGGGGGGGGGRGGGGGDWEGKKTKTEPEGTGGGWGGACVGKACEPWDWRRRISESGTGCSGSELVSVVGPVGF